MKNHISATQKQTRKETRGENTTLLFAPVTQRGFCEISFLLCTTTIRKVDSGHLAPSITRWLALASVESLFVDPSIPSGFCADSPSRLVWCSNAPSCAPGTTSPDQSVLGLSKAFPGW
ncbi:hypothetical protein VFPPC_18709 [Pochonia chlamydosporia 170]|uniref:Uncharacterized protein n=1 Tax=Pochonia chlamydosporia 170 TaxID=1380566 RepID=A0A219ATG5_METCM|nr:hypothetical protein VFPPC_18709 [Pochonia chlamydosporia 170]OWT43564.1 hypothetical protein VFPPC_18709 [Pochonia chlamydosporia 170]